MRKLIRSGTLLGGAPIYFLLNAFATYATDKVTGSIKMELLFTINETLSDSLHPINTTTFATFTTYKATESIKIKLLMTPNQT